MKPTFTTLFLIISYFFTTISSTNLTAPLDQRNRPTIPAETNTEKQRNRPNNVPRSLRNQHPDGLNNDFDYTYLSENIICSVGSESPLALDVYRAIEDLYESDDIGDALGFASVENAGDWVSGLFCTTLATYRSAEVGICSALMQKVDRDKVAEIVMMLVKSCRKEKDDEIRAGGKVKLRWGNIFVNKNVGPKWGE